MIKHVKPGLHIVLHLLKHSEVGTNLQTLVLPSWNSSRHTASAPFWSHLFSPLHRFLCSNAWFPVNPSWHEMPFLHHVVSTTNHSSSSSILCSPFCNCVDAAVLQRMFSSHVCAAHCHVEKCLSLSQKCNTHDGRTVCSIPMISPRNPT